MGSKSGYYIPLPLGVKTGMLHGSSLLSTEQAYWPFFVNTQYSTICRRDNKMANFSFNLVEITKARNYF